VNHTEKQATSCLLDVTLYQYIKCSVSKSFTEIQIIDSFSTYIAWELYSNQVQNLTSKTVNPIKIW